MQSINAFVLPAWFNRLLPSHILWRFHIPERRIQVLTTGTGAPFSDIIPQLLGDLRFAASIVARKDFPRFKHYIQQMRQGQPGQLSFHLISRKGLWRPVWLTSSCDANNPKALEGCLLDLGEMLPQTLPDPLLPAISPSGKDQNPMAKGPVRAEKRISGLLADLCREHRRDGQDLFDALATLVIGAEKNTERWSAHGFDSEAPGADELDQLSQLLKKVFDEKNPVPFIVNDTLSSHHPLDWALFVRSSLQSYRIEPLIHRRRLKGAVIFASSQAWRYHTDRVKELDLLVDTLRPYLLQKG